LDGAVPRLRRDAMRQTTRELAVPLAFFVASRALTYLAARVAQFVRPGLDLGRFLTVWDGSWYLRIAEHGYPDHVPAAHGIAVHSQIPFFPLYPMLARVVDLAAPGHAAVALVLTAIAIGAVATCMVFLAALRLFGRPTANRAAALFCFLPGAWVLGFAYAEGLMIALSIGAILALERRRWVLAGALGALATLSRPSAVALVPVAAWAAVVAIRQRREWRALVAPLLTPLGGAGFLAYLWMRTGEIDAWFRVQHEAWGEHPDFGASAFHEVRVLVTHPLADPNDLIVGLTILSTGVMLWYLLRARLPMTYVIFTAGILALAFSSAILLPRPRFVFEAFPLVLGTARFLRAERLGLVVAVGAAAMTVLTFWYGYSWGRLVILPP